MENIEIVLLFSGKRKSGKDFITHKLNEKLGSEKSEIIRISEPIKSEWAKMLNLNLTELLSDSSYKEKYRKEMIVWSDQVRSKDYGFFCREAMKKASKQIIIVSDIRRKNDIKFFEEILGDKIKKIRINCSNVKRIERGWIYEDGVDNVQSECDLDDYEKWDLEITNEDTSSDIIIEQISNKFF